VTIYAAATVIGGDRAVRAALRAAMDARSDLSLPDIAGGVGTAEVGAVADLIEEGWMQALETAIPQDLPTYIEVVEFPSVPDAEQGWLTRWRRRHPWNVVQVNTSGTVVLTANRIRSIMTEAVNVKVARGLLDRALGGVWVDADADAARKGIAARAAILAGK
jgi:hypothetical protein